MLDRITGRGTRVANCRAAALKAAALFGILALAACSELTDAEPVSGPTLPAAFAPGGKPSGNGRILFQSLRDEPHGWEIYSMNADGSGVFRLTNSPGLDYLSTWSPDGKKIVFTSTRQDPKGDLYVMNADGSGVTRLTNSPGFDGEASWSKDGTQIVFSSTRGAADPLRMYPPDFELYLMNADGTGVGRMTFNNSNDSAPAWSPDGKHIVWTSAVHNPANWYQTEVYVMTTDLLNVTRLTFNGQNNTRPHWSPNGKQISFANGTGIYIMNADGSQPTQIIAGAKFGAPSWSPDGQKITYMGTTDDPFGDVYVANKDGSARTRITSYRGQDFPYAWRH